MKPIIKELGKVIMTPEGIHDSTKEYDILSMVVDNNTGNGYVSKKQVPAGIELDNEEYWKLLFKVINNAVIVPGEGKNSGILYNSESEAIGDYSTSIGNKTKASGNNSHAEGQGTIASGNGSHAEGIEYNEIGTSAMADAAHAEGAGVVVKGQAAHGEGVLNVAGRTQEEAVAALADFPNLGGTTEQKVSKLIGFGSHVEGATNKALGSSSHAEGYSTQALVNSTHAEGDSTTASGEAAHSEGYNTTASGNQAHAEGYHTEATANQAHAEGQYTKATSGNAHAEGKNTTANGEASHTEGYYTVANNNVEHAEGQYNVSHTGNTRSERTVHSVGIGTGLNDHTNAHEIMANGDHYIYGIGGYVGKDIVNAKSLQKVIKELQNNIGGIKPLEIDDSWINAGDLTEDVVNLLNKACFIKHDDYIYPIIQADSPCLESVIQSLYNTYSEQGYTRLLINKAWGEYTINFDLSPITLSGCELYFLIQYDDNISTITKLVLYEI